MNSITWQGVAVGIAAQSFMSVAWSFWWRWWWERSVRVVPRSAYIIDEAAAIWSHHGSVAEGWRRAAEFHAAQLNSTRQTEPLESDDVPF